MVILKTLPKKGYTTLGSKSCFAKQFIKNKSGGEDVYFREAFKRTYNLAR